jgi:hypothetical protein
MFSKTLMGLSMLALLAAPAVASANERWNAEHPRRAEVNQRLENQNARITEGVRDGKLTRNEARRLHAQDHRIRREERTMAAANGGHITKREQRMLNRQENRTSRRIYRQKH